MRLFDIDYELLIGRPYGLLAKVLPTTGEVRYIERGTNSTGIPSEDFCTVPQNFQRIAGYQLTAKISQTKDQSIKNRISVYNLDDDVISKFKKDDLIILRAGYKRGQNVGVEEDIQHPDIFVGQIIRVSTKYQGQDKITEFLCGEGITIKKNSKVSKSYPPGVSRLDVLRDLAQLSKQQGIPLGGIKLPTFYSDDYKVLQSSLLSGYTAKGNLFEEIERFCESVNMRSFTALGKLYIESKKVVTVDGESPRVPLTSSTAGVVTSDRVTSTTVFKVTPEAIKGRIFPMEDNSGTSSKAEGSSERTGLKFTLYLDGRISVNKVMRLLEQDEESYNGDYEITSVNHNIDYRGSTFETEVTLGGLS